MKTKLRNTLRRALQQWAEEAADTKDMPSGTWTPETVPLMAQAAEAVFDANFSAQAFASEQKRGKA